MAPLVRSANGYVKGSGREGRSSHRLVMNLLVQACVGRVFKDVPLRPVMEVVQVLVEWWCICTLEHIVALRLIPVERLLWTIRAILIIPREIITLFWATTMRSR